MPFQPIPTTSYRFWSGGQQQAPSQGQIVGAVWPLSAESPRPIEHFNLTAFYLPVAVTTTAGGTLPSVASFTAQLFLSGVLVFQDQFQINLLAIGASPGWVGGSASGNASLQNPVSWYPGQTLQIGFQIALDEAVDDLNVLLAGVLNDPAHSGTGSPLAGSIGYSTTSDDLLMGEIRETWAQHQVAAQYVRQ